MYNPDNIREMLKDVKHSISHMTTADPYVIQALNSLHDAIELMLPEPEPITRLCPECGDEIDLDWPYQVCTPCGERDAQHDFAAEDMAYDAARETRVFGRSRGRD